MPSQTVVDHYCQMRSKAHTAPTVPLDLHHTRIDKYAMQKIFKLGIIEKFVFSMFVIDTQKIEMIPTYLRV